MAKCIAKFGNDVCHAKHGDECMQSFCGFTQSYREPEFDKQPGPTPAALAQQLADLTGLEVAIFQESDGSWWIDTGDGANLMYLSFVIKPEGHWVKFKTAIKISRPVSYAGRWQDSKVTATPRQVKP